MFSCSDRCNPIIIFLYDLFSSYCCCFSTICLSFQNLFSMFLSFLQFFLLEGSFSIFFQPSPNLNSIYFNVSPIVQSQKHRKMQQRELRTLSWSGCRWRSSTKSSGESIRPNSESLPERRDEYSKTRFFFSN